MSDKRIILALSIAAALLYNIWPLGYVLDPGVLQHSYISVLQAAGRSYAWLFVLGDVFTGALVIMAAWLRWHLHTGTGKGTLAGYAIFGLATAVGALMPIGCEANIAACGLSPLQVLAPHDLASMVAALGLFGYLRSLALATRSPSARLALWLWCGSGLLLVLSVGTNSFTTPAQATFLVMSGAALVMLPTSLPDSTKENAET